MENITSDFFSFVFRFSSLEYADQFSDEFNDKLMSLIITCAEQLNSTIPSMKSSSKNAEFFGITFILCAMLADGC